MFMCRYKFHLCQVSQHERQWQAANYKTEWLLLLTIEIAQLVWKCRWYLCCYHTFWKTVHRQSTQCFCVITNKNWHKNGPKTHIYNHFKTRSIISSAKELSLESLNIYFSFPQQNCWLSKEVFAKFRNVERVFTPPQKLVEIKTKDWSSASATRSLCVALATIYLRMLML